MQDVHDGVAQSTSVKASSGISRSRSVLTRLTSTRALYFWFGLSASGLLFAYLQFSTRAICCGDFDGYYHIKWSQLLWEGLRTTGTFPPAFKWLPLTTLNPTDYVDHHFLFHVLQIPFIWFGDLRLAAKISAWLFATLAVTSCYLLVLRYRLAYAPLWFLALLASSAAFLYRMNMTKAPSVSLILTIIGIYLLFEGRYRWLMLLAFLYVWTYSMFVMLGVAALIWTGVVGWSENRFEWRPVAYVSVGILAGFIINPYFPANISLFIEHVLIKFKTSEFSTNVGLEWYPYSTWDLLNTALVASLAMIVGYVAFDPVDRKHAARPLFFLIFSTVLLAVTFRSRRWIEYWPPFGVLFAAFSLQPFFDGARYAITTRLPPDVLKELQPYLDRHESPKREELSRQHPWYETVAVAVVTIALCAGVYSNVRVVHRDIAGDQPPEQYQKGMEWIRDNVPPEEIVFNTSWDDFPKMFYHNPRHAYVSGLDLTYLLDRNPELFKLYEGITLGKEADPAPLIRDRFKTRYVFIDAEGTRGDFYRRLMESERVEEVFLDEHCAVLQILDQPREPQADDANMSTPPAEVNTADPSDTISQPSATRTRRFGQRRRWRQRY